MFVQATVKDYQSDTIIGYMEARLDTLFVCVSDLLSLEDHQAPPLGASSQRREQPSSVGRDCGNGPVWSFGLSLRVEKSG